jgi:KaiC domain protein
MSEDGGTEDSDWFEEALREGDAEAEAEAAGESEDDRDATDEGEPAADADLGGDDATDEGGPVADADTGGEETPADSAFAADAGEEESLFDEDFGSAFEAAGGEEFADEDFESDLPRIDVGIDGLDEMIQGGIPRRHLIVCIGGAGSGKTTFGLQFLHHGLEAGEHGVFLTLEQSYESIMATANERGWEFDRYEDEGMLAVVDLDPVEMANSLDNIQDELPELVRDFDADRLVLDSVSLLEMMYDDPAHRRTEVFDFTRSLKDAGVTTFLTSEASESNPYASRHGIIEYLTDAVFVLQYVRGETSETRLAVEIQKIRNANHSRAKKPYEITMDGISVYQQANIF